jgi:hypothetical protein
MHVKINVFCIAYLIRRLPMFWSNLLALFSGQISALKLEIRGCAETVIAT